MYLESTLEKMIGGNVTVNITGFLSGKTLAQVENVTIGRGWVTVEVKVNHNLRLESESAQKLVLAHEAAHVVEFLKSRKQWLGGADWSWEKPTNHYNAYHGQEFEAALTEILPEWREIAKTELIKW